MKKQFMVMTLLVALFTFSCNSDDDGNTDSANPLSGTIWEGQTDNTLLINFINDTKVTIEVPGNIDDGQLDYTFDGTNGTITFPESNGLPSSVTNFEVAGAILTLLNNSLGSPGEDTFVRRN